MAYTFDLLPVGGDLTLDGDVFNRVRYLLLESQPATKVRVLPDPWRIRVRAQGRPAEVAPGVLARLEELVGTPLTVVNVRGW